ncbi:MAG: aldehyde dehydrogenase family protein [Calditrichia bacterium]
MIHIPILRAGKPYKSLTTVTIPHFRTGEPVAEMSQANPGLINKDMRDAAHNKKVLDAIPIRELLDMCKRAAKYFNESELPMGDGTQTPEEYITNLSATTGMPEALCRTNMAKITLVMEGMEEVLGGLTRGLDLSILDKGWVEQDGRPLNFLCETNALGAILPSNSPGVHSLWIQAIALKVPVVLKPGSQEPWTPYRIAQSFMAAGCPPEVFGYYPTSYDGAREILLRTGRSMFFGDKNTVAPWKNDKRVQIHGPGWSKVLFGEDQVDDFNQHLDVVEHSVVANGGRSCINASGLWVPRRGREIAEELAKRLAKVTATTMDDPNAQIAAFANKKLAYMLNDAIDSQLQTEGAEDLTAKYREGSRLVELDDCVFLLPTVVYCEDPQHPLASSEYLFPFVTVVEVPQDRILNEMGPTLVVSAITKDQNYVNELFASPNVERLNIGPVPTMKIAWDQPHEGNLFEHLYRQRALHVQATLA